MPSPTPLQKLRLRHQYDLDDDYVYAVQCEFDGFGFAAEELSADEARGLLTTLLATAEQRLKRKSPGLPYMQLVDVYTIMIDDEWEPCTSAWDTKNQECLDCGVNTIDINEYYMVLDAVWQPAVPEDAGMVCIGCLEKRFGRELVRTDFIDAPINAEPAYVRSERLTARLSGPGALSYRDW